MMPASELDCSESDGIDCVGSAFAWTEPKAVTRELQMLNSIAIE
jgi:hypothetical protein